MPKTIMEDVQAIFAAKPRCAPACPRAVCRRHRRCLPPRCGPRFYKCLFMPDEMWAPVQREVGLAIRKRKYQLDAERMQAEAEGQRP